MASNDQHQDQKRSNDQLHEQNRQLLDTIKKTLELQEKGLIPNLNIDPQILESLSHENPEQYFQGDPACASTIMCGKSKWKLLPIHISIWEPRHKNQLAEIDGKQKQITTSTHT